jgi:SAM-dependent methyltransferase
MQVSDDNWAEGTAYDTFMGRWSRAVASEFIGLLDPAPRLRWLDIGCGTGALSSALVQYAEPELVVGCDPSRPFIEYARRQIVDPRVSFLIAADHDLPELEGGFGGIVSGLVLNFIADPVEAVRAMAHRVHPDGLVAAYVWDYAGRMDFLRAFWDAAVALDPAAAPLDEAGRFPLCNPEELERTFKAAGLDNVQTSALDIPTAFSTFSAYWDPFLAGTGPAPRYVASLDEGRRAKLADRIRSRLKPGRNGSIEMIARAWAVRGQR